MIFCVLLNSLDGIGVTGSLFHIAFALAFVGSALFIFLYLWKRGRLDMDQEPAEKMLEDDEKSGDEDDK